MNKFLSALRRLTKKIAMHLRPAWAAQLVSSYPETLPQAVNKRQDNEEGLSGKMVLYKMKSELLCRNRWMENSKQLFRVQRSLSRSMSALGRKYPAWLEQGNVRGVEAGVG